jgi:hypothetical protein
VLAGAADMRWIPLVLIFIGVFGLIKTILMNDKSSFDDGSFIVQMAILIGSLACFAAAIITFFVQWAMA